MPFDAPYWGFLSPRGRVRCPEECEEHHRDLARRLLEDLPITGTNAKEDLILHDYIAFDVNTEGCATFIGREDDRNFRRRLTRFLRDSPEVYSMVEWWFVLPRNHAGEAEGPEEAIDLLLSDKCSQQRLAA